MAESREFEIITALLEAHRHKIAAPVEADDLIEDQLHRGFEQSRIRAARSWLFALGYLDDEADKPGYDDALRAAVEAFQTEAGLTVDGWIGTEQTWPRLRQLITFDDALDADYWVRDGIARPALRRAAKARLFLYGFGKRDKFLDAAELRTQTEAFLTALRHLKFKTTAVPTDEPQRLAFLLSHDDHVEFLSRPEIDGVFKNIDDPKDRTAAYGLLMNVAKVELWLAQTGSVHLTETLRKRPVNEKFGIPGKLRTAMNTYIDAMDLDDAHASAHRGAFRSAINQERFPAAVRLFLQATVLFLPEDDDTAVERIDQLHRFYDMGTKTGAAHAEATAKALRERGGLRSRLWDGLRRAFAWVRRALIKALKAGKKALSLAKKIAGYAFQVASEAVAFLHRAVADFLAHVETATDREHVDENGHVILIRSFGRDSDLFVSSSAPAGYPANYTQRLRISAQIFRWACKILGTLVGFAIRLAEGALNAAVLLRALVFALTEASGLRTAFREIRRLQASFDALAPATPETA